MGFELKASRRSSDGYRRRGASRAERSAFNWSAWALEHVALCQVAAVKRDAAPSGGPTKSCARRAAV
jgi:hypothetical protein